MQPCRLQYSLKNCRNRSDPEEMASEEMEVAEVTLEALTAVVHHPNTHKYRNYIMKHTANMLGKFMKILDMERSLSDPNNVFKMEFW